MINSNIVQMGSISMPQFENDNLYMYEINMQNPFLPKNLKRWESFIKKLLSFIDIKPGKAYLTIDQKKVAAGKTHRRGGAHVDGNYIFSWGGGWLTGDNGRFLNKKQHELQYCSKTGGMLIVSDYPTCRVWPGSFNQKPNQGGNCEHFKSDLLQSDSFILQKNEVYFMNSTAIHESLPLDKTVKRSLVRITLPHDY